MKQGALVDSQTGRAVVSEVFVANNAKERLFGLLALPKLEANSGLLLMRCRSIHTCFMSYVIDIVFLDDSWTVQKLCPSLAPWRMATCLRATHTLELLDGQIAAMGITEQQSLVWQNS